MKNKRTEKLQNYWSPLSSTIWMLERIECPDGNWRTLGKNRFCLNERTFDFFKKLTKNLKRNAKTIFSTTMVDLLPICFCVTLIFFKKNANTCYLIVYTKFNHWSNIRIFTNNLVQPLACNGFVFIRTESRHISASLNPNWAQRFRTFLVKTLVYVVFRNRDACKQMKTLFVRLVSFKLFFAIMSDLCL